MPPRQCRGPFSCFNVTNNTVNIADGLREDSSLQDSRLPSQFVYNDHNREVMIENGVMRRDQTWNDYKRTIYQLLLRPKEKVREEIRRMRIVVHQRSVSIGIHIRMGGLLANDCERVSMIDQEALEAIPGRIEAIRMTLTNTTKEVSIYLSSDSDRAISFLHHNLNPDYLIVTASKHTRGRTTGNRVTEEKVNGALLDLFVLADCDALLTTQGSGFSAIAGELSKASIKHVIPVKRGEVKCHIVTTTPMSNCCICWVLLYLRFWHIVYR